MLWRKISIKNEKQGRSVAVLDGVKESLTEKVPFQQRAEGSEGIRLTGRAFQVKGHQQQKHRSRVGLVCPEYCKPASGCGKVLYLTHCASVG